MTCPEIDSMIQVTCRIRPIGGRFLRQKTAFTSCTVRASACAFGETIARFRPSVQTLARLEQVEDDDPVDPSLFDNSIPADWRFKRRIGWIQLESALRFVDVHNASTITQLRISLAGLLDHFGLSELDLSDITSQNRRLTQEIARFVYEQEDEIGRPMFAGVRYMSRLHQDWECWAMFHDRMKVTQQHVGAIYPDDPGLLEAAEALGLTPPAAF
jgi:hypothetical protein